MRWLSSGILSMKKEYLSAFPFSRLGVHRCNLLLVHFVMKRNVEITYFSVVDTQRPSSIPAERAPESIILPANSQQEGLCQRQMQLPELWKDYLQEILVSDIYSNTGIRL
ncbi:hypothetical protein V6N11_026814 [Hibiscus sabdariffa]|uniref:Uncharacterized protein n=1 Tax=Hibiscus sabdariffa TaxID=183260 RepID=A0ABR2SWT2_9ROSI